MSDKIEQELLEMLQEPTAEKVRRDQIKADILMQQVGRALAPQINAALDRLAVQMIESVKRGMEEWCPGCGEKTLLCPDLCEDCLAVNNS